MGTAGGVKTTTIAVLILSIAAYLQGKKDVEVYGRRIRESYLRSAMVVAGTSVLILFTMTVLLSAVMPGVDLADVLYEITSAGATVGLSRGLTPQLNVAGKWIVILTMSGTYRTADTWNSSCDACTQQAGKHHASR